MRFQTLVFALGAALAAPAVGCYATDDAYVAYEAPPPPQEEVVVERPGYFFVHGHWLRDGGRWGWHGGYYARERPGYVYAEGRWDSDRGGRFRWREGGWRARITRR